MYEDFTPEYLKSRILEDTNTGITKIEGSFASDMASGVAYSLYELWQELGILYNMIFLDSLEGEWLDAKCRDYDMERSPGKCAEGTLEIQSRYEISIPKGTLFSCNDLEYKTKDTVTISKDENDGKYIGTVEITAKETGSIYNIQNSDTVRPVLPIPGIESVTFKTLSTVGIDAETDEALLSRLRDHIKAAGSGCKNDYIRWAKEVAGVGNVEVVPTWNGAGTVKVIITDSEYQGASDELIAAVSEHIEGIRPIGAVVTVCAAKTVKLKLTADVVRNTNINLSDIEEDFKKQAEEYAKELAKSRGYIRISKLCSLLMQTRGVIDCDNITIITLGEDGTNEITTENLTVPEESIPVISEVVLSEKSV